ncbi:Transcription factor VOZ1 [Zea mays]|uniref:Transcription factor VOZ1 n=1 Tax=Zea mays TaxID=4577 RepID=A0A1D6P7H4_MAIZE|nr:Transcription factor VOZ1 [Zea mays]
MIHEYACDNAEAQEWALELFRRDWLVELYNAMQAEAEVVAEMITDKTFARKVIACAYELYAMDWIGKNHYTSDPELILLTDGASKGVMQMLNTNTRK